MLHKNVINPNLLPKMLNEIAIEHFKCPIFTNNLVSYLILSNVSHLCVFLNCCLVFS